MKDNKDYEQAVLQAKENFDDLQERGNDAVGGDALALLDNLLTSEEIMESNLRVSLIGEIIKARQERGISQRRLGELSGVNNLLSHEWKRELQVRSWILFLKY